MRVFPCVLTFVGLLPTALAGDHLLPRAADFAAKYQSFTMVNGPQRRLLYGSYRGTLHLIESREGKLVTVLTRELWSPVLRILAADLDGDGQDEVVGHTQNARLFVLRGSDLQDIWNTPEGRFKTITALTLADVDQDKQLEIVFLADDLLRFHSTLQDLEEWKSQITFTATQIAVGEVDGNAGDEIVFNSGLVIGALFRDVKWTYAPGFGNRIDLYDIDADGILEILADGGDGLMRVFDADERRLKWQ